MDGAVWSPAGATGGKWDALENGSTRDARAPEPEEADPNQGRPGPAERRPPPERARHERHATTHQRPGAEPLIEQIAAEARHGHSEREAGERCRSRRGARAGVVTEVDPA